MNPLNAERFDEFFREASLAIAEMELAERRKQEPDHVPEKPPTAKDPFPWQSRLARQVCAGTWPQAIALPTAAGKTACIDIAVFALACGAPEAPRRIFFVVDRRIVVDQAFLHADALAKVLDRAADGVLREAADQLRDRAEPGWLAIGPADRLGILQQRWRILDEPDVKKRQKLLDKLSDLEQKWCDTRPLDVYALRGGMYRETAWTRSPLQPTIIASTVDQVGSRLLFRGYGVSDSMKPVHAGLVGNDALILLDEAHCAKPFQQTADAVAHYRTWNETLAPFKFVTITATPTTDEDVMRADADDFKHPVLGSRIRASKPAKLVVAEKAKGKKGTEELVKELAKQAKELAVGSDCVGIIVNRVRTARDLKKTLGDEAVLLTGRMRPLDRDRLFEAKLKPLLSNAEGTPPKFVIGTQCLEVGADFDFHALISECASLDALRQRFGRLNRVARRPGPAKAVIVIRGDETDDTSEDPIYGASVGNTWQWLKKNAPDGMFDFGVSVMAAKLEGVPRDELNKLNAPSADAPVLFPAHLDCWVQTHPIPTPDPEPALFLHGPQKPGQPDVQVVFRSDLGTDDKKWAEIVGLCPPSSSEAVAVPIGLFKKWLAGERMEDNTSDIEGGAMEEEDSNLEPEGHFALCWNGPGAKETGLVSDPMDVKPNRTYVVPCTAKDANALGDFIGDPPADYAEEAFQRSRDKAFLRLPGVTLSEEMSDDDAMELIETAMRQRRTDASPAWEVRAVEHLLSLKNRIVDEHPGGGLIATGRRRLKQFAPEFLDEDASSYSPGRSAVTLVDHSRGVAEYAARFAKACGLPEELFRTAGLLHDLGKLDPRFQAMLKQGSPRTAVGPPWAKSAKGPRNKEERAEARKIHHYPSGARHELLSAAIVAKRSDDDDLLHLIATHHGSARPFANAVEENDAAQPCDIDLFDVKLKRFPCAQEIAGWNAELPERFWRTVRKYGWWGSAYLEAVFRLADHAQSRAEQEGDAVEHTGPTPAVTLSAKELKKDTFPLPLPGLDGSNPLAFLAALGTFRLANEVYPGAMLRWRYENFWHPILELPSAVEADKFVSQLHEQIHHTAKAIANKLADDFNKDYRKRRKATEAAMKVIKSSKLRGAVRELAIAEQVRPLALQEQQARRVWLDALESAVPAPFLSLGKSIAVSATEFAVYANRAAERLRERRGAGNSDASFVPAFGCEACTDRNGRVIPTEFQLITGSGHQYFLETFGTLMESITVEQVRRSLYDSWTYQDSRLSFRWEPMDDRRYAVSWDDPSSTEVRAEHAANLLAANALPLFPVAPSLRSAETTGFHSDRDFAYLTWPMWERPHGVDATRSFLQSGTFHIPKPRTEGWESLGLRTLFRIRKYEVGTPPLSKWNVSTSVVI